MFEFPTEEATQNSTNRRWNAILIWLHANIIFWYSTF